MKRLATILIAALAISACAKQQSFTDKVDPMIGSGGHGHVFVGASVPRGMVTLGPQQINDSWDWCSGYHISDTLLIGFSHTHLSGTGIGDRGDVLLMPFDPARTKRTKGWVNQKQDSIGHIYAHLDHALEQVRPGEYTVSLPDYGIKARLTATERVGLHEYKFSGREGAILVDLQTGIGWDRCVQSELRMLSPTRFEGYRRSKGWARDHCWYFAAELSEPVAAQELEQLENDGRATVLKFALGRSKTVRVKVALSSVSCEGAWMNMREELPGWDFDRAAKAADRKWNEALGAIEIEPLDARQERIFYTSLYHSLIFPALFSDVDGQYRGSDGQIHRSDLPQYTILSLWDTYRAEQPLMTLIDPSFSRAIADTYLNIYRGQGKLPVWHLDGNETDCMVGNPGVIALGDLVLKGYADDPAAAYEAMLRSSQLAERGLDAHGRWGFIPFDRSSEDWGLAKSLEYAIADAAVAKVARALGDTANADRFAWRSRAYERYYDPSTGFLRGRTLAGKFREPFDPFAADNLTDYVEGNGWQYTFLVPHDVEGLVRVFGGTERFRSKLDSLFVAEGDLSGAVADVTGLIGQYAHGNEPSHHVAYMYNWLPGGHSRCCELVRRIMDELYFDDENGVCGNEDCGQMSAWYVLSALGLYQVDPAGGDFAVGSPAVRSARVDLGSGRALLIRALGNSSENIYVQSAEFRPADGSDPLILDHDHMFLPWSDLSQGGELILHMGSTPTGV